MGNIVDLVLRTIWIIKKYNYDSTTAFPDYKDALILSTIPSVALINCATLWSADTKNVAGLGEAFLSNLSACFGDLNSCWKLKWNSLTKWESWSSLWKRGPALGHLNAENSWLRHGLCIIQMQNTPLVYKASRHMQTYNQLREAYFYTSQSIRTV